MNQDKILKAYINIINESNNKNSKKSLKMKDVQMHTEQEVRSRIANLINVEDIYSDEIEDILDSWSENRCEPGLSFHDEIEAAIDDPKYANGEEDPEYYAFWDLLGNKSDEEILSVLD